MAIDFSKKHLEKNVTPEAQVAVVEPKAPAVVSAPKYGSVEGETDSTDLVKPYLSLAQAVAPLCQSSGWKAGDFVLGKDYGLYRPGTSNPLKVVVLAAKKVFVEDLLYGSEAVPRRFDTTAQVIEAGGRVEKGSFIPNLNCVILVEKPVKVFNQDNQAMECPLFNIELAGRHFAPGLYNIGGTSYNGAGKTIITAVQSAPGKKSYSIELWLTSVLQKSDKFSWFSPVVKNGPAQPAEFVKALEAKLAEL